MRSLFAKILVWFLATAAITAIGFVLTSALTFTVSEDRRPPLSRLPAYLLNEARHAYETGGRQGLAAFFDRLRAEFDFQAILIGADGRDLLTGADYSELLAGAGRRGRHFFLRRDRVVLAHTSEDGRYRLFLMIPRMRLGQWFLLPQHLWVLGAVVLFCYLLARHLTTPVRQLQRAVEGFGQGNFSARARSNRRDELGELARTFDRMADRLETLLVAERRLLLDISHELRSPLARLAVAVELARSGADREAALDRIQKEADRLNALVAELLQVTRAEGDAGSLRAEPVRLDELLAEIAGDCRVEAQARGGSIEMRAPEPVTIKGDPELLRRAVENVIRNAIRYAPHGTAIDVSLATAGGNAVLRVRDYGPGVPENSLPRLFDPFYRVEADRDRTTGGAGLGLSIARRAIELHRGRIIARNASPGLLVEFELPVEAAG